MTDPLRFIPPRVQLTDPRTGMISREWYLFFQGVFSRIGGANGASSTDIVASLFEDAGSSETNAMLFELDQAASQYAIPQPFTVEQVLQAEISELRDTVTEMKKDLDAIRQGTLI
jgi:hypothetical protein